MIWDLYSSFCAILYLKVRFRKAPKAVRIVLPIVIMLLLAAVCLYIDFATEDIVWIILGWIFRACAVALCIYVIVKIVRYKGK